MFNIKLRRKKKEFNYENFRITILTIFPHTSIGVFVQTGMLFVKDIEALFVPVTQATTATKKSRKKIHYHSRDSAVGRLRGNFSNIFKRTRILVVKNPASFPNFFWPEPDPSRWVSCCPPYVGRDQLKIVGVFLIENTKDFRQRGASKLVKLSRS